MASNYPARFAGMWTRYGENSRIGHARANAQSIQRTLYRRYWTKVVWPCFASRSTLGMDYCAVPWNSLRWGD
ncbi:hypothetical protein HDG40_004083 [Paraburkholderia sp. JPY158]|uniref:Uncharacterized protein n=1 Tax=Paraburkholderia atlantica TaxID=2654982 RepID=A0A7W8QA43_PARAM|nr:hypothetical protein [Paraburkholderia atlantica]